MHIALTNCLKKLSPQSRGSVLANIDVVAADAFFDAVTNKGTAAKTSKDKLGQILLEATFKYLEPLGIKEQRLRLASMIG